MRATLPSVFFVIGSCACAHDALAFVSPAPQLHKTTIGKSSLLSTSIERHKSQASIKSLLFADQGKTGDGNRKQQDISFLERPKRQGRKQSGRAGGRRRSRIVTLASKKKESPGGVLASRWIRVGLPLVAVVLLVKSLLGSPSGRSDYVYYQSSVYESRTYNTDGRVETARKESVQSNIPSLLDGKRLRDSSSQYLLRESPDRDFDRELDVMMKRLQQSMFDEFFREPVEEKLKRLHL